MVKSSDRPVRSQQNLNWKVVRANQVKSGEKNLRVLGPKIWERLPPHTKTTAENLSVFRRLIKTQSGVPCKYNLCISIHVYHLMQLIYDIYIYIYIYIYFLILLVGFD